MAVFKCKMCGGALKINNETVAVCEYCGTQQTLPKLDDEHKANLYDRANHFRRNNEFDKAMIIYEQILNGDNTDAESYWSLVLCKYGVEYVEDPASGKKVPTVHRVQFTSVLADENYQKALEYASEEQKELYQAEAELIDNLQKNYLNISRNEQPFDVFICYKETDANGERTPDSVFATDLYHHLTKEGFKVFFARITLEDKLGSAYEPYIFAALNSAKVMVVIGTKPEYFEAVWVRNEWSRYLELIKKGENKVLIPAYKDMDAYNLPKEFAYLQAQDMSKLGFLQDLIHGIKKITQNETSQAAPAPAPAPAPVNSGKKSSSVAKIIVACVAAVAVCVSALLVLGGKLKAPLPTDTDVVTTIASTTIAEETTANTTIPSETTTTTTTTTAPVFIPDNQQVVYVRSSGSTAQVSLEVWEDGVWNTVLTTSGTIGKDGVSTEVSESTAKTPAGTFNLNFAFGATMVDTDLDFLMVTEDIYWVDDVNSPYYNMWRNGADGKDWDSAEALYSQFTNGKMRHCIAFDYNGNSLTGEGIQKNGGSVIFLCGRADALSATYGDIYIPEGDMLTLLSYLDKDKNPVITIS